MPDKIQPNEQESMPTVSQRLRRVSFLSLNSARFREDDNKLALASRDSLNRDNILTSVVAAPLPKLTALQNELQAPSISAQAIDFAGPKSAKAPNPAIESRSHSAEILAQAVKGEYQYAKLGLILGVLAILGGIVLGLHGVAGHTSWTAKVLGFESNINDAAPGVVLFVVGVFFVWITKPGVELGDLRG
jgi:hypothetical protein